MPLTTTEDLLKRAQKGSYAVGAFNAENMEMVKAIAEAADELDAPVIIQTTPSTIRYGGLGFYGANVRAAAELVKIPVALHLDHGADFDMAARALRAGYTSIMIDGSKLPFQDNIALTKSVVKICRPNGIPVEAELGKVGGKEDGAVSGGPQYTDPEDARVFVKETGISSLAVAIGTAHGFYKGTPVLNKKLLKQIRETVDLPLVLHGASGLSDKDVADCIRLGICKVNFATELRDVFTKGVRSVLQDTSVFDPKKYGGAGIERVKELVRHKITVCGCAGKA